MSEPKAMPFLWDFNHSNPIGRAVVADDGTFTAVITNSDVARILSDPRLTALSIGWVMADPAETRHQHVSRTGHEVVVSLSGQGRCVTPDCNYVEAIELETPMQHAQRTKHNVVTRPNKPGRCAQPGCGYIDITTKSMRDDKT